MWRGATESDLSFVAQFSMLCHTSHAFVWFRFAGSLRASGYNGVTAATITAASTPHSSPGDIVLGVWQSRDDWQAVMDILDVTEIAMEQVHICAAAASEPLGLICIF